MTDEFHYRGRIIRATPHRSSAGVGRMTVLWNTILALPSMLTSSAHLVSQGPARKP